jgi:hypothetical protein
MISPLRNQKPPYEPPSSIVYFHDWRYVQHGQVGWRAHDGGRPPMWITEPVPPLRYEPRFLPVGIRLRAQPARRTEPFLLPQMTDEMYLFGGTVIHDEGTYRLWFDCWPAEQIGDPNYKMGGYNHVRYAESDDGETWRFPRLGLVERPGSRENNVVYGSPLFGPSGYHGGCVFKDPSAPPDERYKMFYQGYFTEEMKEHYLRERPDDVDAYCADRSEWAGLFGAVSPDGLKWTWQPEPLSAQVSDTHNVCEYDPVLEQYVAYCRNWYFHRRGIGRIAAERFRRFPLSEELFWPAPSMAPDELWYVNAKTKMPGTNDYHVMFPMRWSIRSDKFDFFLATSPDNVVWHFAPGGPVCEPGDPGSWDGGVVAPGLGLVELPGDRMGIPLAATPVPHKHPRLAPLGALAWAWWPRGRLVALETEIEGSFALQPLRVKGRRMHLNFQSAPAGCVRIQLLDGGGKEIPGRAFDDCDWLSGDELDREVTWKGEADMGHQENGELIVCFQMRCARLFSVRFA